MPHYQAYRRRVRSLYPIQQRMFGDLLALEIAPPGSPFASVSDFGYFLPIWNGTQLGRDAAAAYGFDGSQSLTVIVRCPTHYITLWIPASHVTVEDWLPLNFVKIGAETILHYFQLNPHDLPPPYTGNLPAVLRMVAPNGCQPRPPGPAAPFAAPPLMP